MSREVPEWIGKTDDTAIPDRVRLRVYEKANGDCAVCGQGVLSCEFDHIIPLILGGANRESNIQLLCVPCHRAKTKRDVKIKAKVARVKKKHIGIKKPRTIRSWRRFDGSIVHAERER